MSRDEEAKAEAEARFNAEREWAIREMARLLLIGHKRCLEENERRDSK